MKVLSSNHSQPMNHHCYSISYILYTDTCMQISLSLSLARYIYSIYVLKDIHIDIWAFPKIMIPPNHPFVHRVFHYFHHPFWGVKSPIFGKIHICTYTLRLGVKFQTQLEDTNPTLGQFSAVPARAILNHNDFQRCLLDGR